MKFAITIYSLIISFNAYSQVLKNGSNKLIYSSFTSCNTFLLQLVNVESDSTIFVKSTIVQLKDSNDRSKLFLLYFDSAFITNNMSIEVISNREIKVERFYIRNELQIMKNSQIFSLKNNEKIIDFYNDKIYNENEIIFDLVSLRAIKRDTLNSVAEFVSTPGLFEFNRYVFVKDLWAIRYFYFKFAFDQFTLVSFNNSLFDANKWLNKLN